MRFDLHTNAGYEFARSNLVKILIDEEMPEEPQTILVIAWTRLFEVTLQAALSRGETTQTLGMPDA